MKIFTDSLNDFTLAPTWDSDVPFVTYYSDMHIGYGVSGNTLAKPVYAALHVEIATEDYLSASDIGGNASPLTIVTPEYAPYPYVGNSVMAYITTAQGGLRVASKELEDDYEFVTIVNQTSGATLGYLVWGTFKVTKTDFYTPDLMGAITTARSWNPIKGLTHSSLDYSEKIANAIVG